MRTILAVIGLVVSVLAGGVLALHYVLLAGAFGLWLERGAA